ncbi:MAG: hypothetical protein WCQ95_14615 [Bacteroidota bacterium]
MKKENIVLLVIGFILILFGALYTFTREAICSSWDFSHTGQIGDTISGIASPIINIVGSLLIFISFLSQNKANKLQSEHNSFALLYELYKGFNDDFNNLFFYSSTVKDGKEYQGKRALSVFCEILESRKTSTEFKNNSFFNEFLFLMGSLSILFDIVESSNISNQEKKYILRIIHFFYSTRLKEHVLKILELTKDIEIHSAFRELLSGAEEKIENNYVKNF